jgi:hypothetical protein
MVLVLFLQATLNQAIAEQEDKYEQMTMIDYDGEKHTVVVINDDFVWIDWVVVFEIDILAELGWRVLVSKSKEEKMQDCLLPCKKHRPNFYDTPNNGPHMTSANIQ